MPWTEEQLKKSVLAHCLVIVDSAIRGDGDGISIHQSCMESHIEKCGYTTKGYLNKLLGEIFISDAHPKEITQPLNGE